MARAAGQRRRLVGLPARWRPVRALPAAGAGRRGGAGRARSGGGGWSGVTVACNVDSRGEVDAAFAAALAAGATVVAEPTDRPWGGRSGYIADRRATAGRSPGRARPASTSVVRS
ncbi:VOC family protein [Micromonospora sp. NPDC005203]|uniref:VOC family protein n=1 Tax=Micromonospora sp. NPDC005203 TaxID=3364226 RepID=UPI0036D18A82